MERWMQNNTKKAKKKMVNFYQSEIEACKKKKKFHQTKAFNSYSTGQVWVGALLTVFADLKDEA